LQEVSLKNIQQFPGDLSVHPISNPVDQPLPPLPTLGEPPTHGVIERIPMPAPWDLDAQLHLVDRLALVSKTQKTKLLSATLLFCCNLFSKASRSRLVLCNAHLDSVETYSR
jgi:hypothetical protein